MIALVVIPAVATLGLSLFDYDIVRAPEFIGFDNFAALIADDVFRISVRNSIVFLAIAVPLRMALVVGLALLLHRSSMRGGAFYRVSVFLPVVLPEAALAVAWLWILNPIFGPLNAVLSGLGFAPVAWLTDPLAAQSAIVLIALFAIGEAFVIAVAARRSIPADLYDMAAIEGASSSSLIRFLTLPLMWPIVVVLGLRDAALSLQATLVPSLIVTGGGPPPYATTYVPTFIYEQGFEYLRSGYAAAATALFLGMAVVLTFVQLRLLRRFAARLS